MYLHKRSTLNVTVLRLIEICYEMLNLEDETPNELGLFYKTDKSSQNWIELSDDSSFLKNCGKGGGKNLYLKIASSKERQFSAFKNVKKVLEKYKNGEIELIPPFYPKQIEIKEGNTDFEHCIENIKAKLRGFGGGTGKSEAVYWEFISAVLVAMVLLVPGTRLDAERVVLKEELVRICVAKESEIKEGLALNITQLRGVTAGKYSKTEVPEGRI